MRFMICEATDGGMIDSIHTYEEVEARLSSNPYWKEAHEQFTVAMWSSGQYMYYPSGIIFCIAEEKTEKLEYIEDAPHNSACAYYDIGGCNCGVPHKGRKPKNL